MNNLKRWIVWMIWGMAMHDPFAMPEYLSGGEVGSSARMIRLGGIEGFSLSSEAIFQNPTRLSLVQNFGVSFFSTTLMGEVSYLNASAALNTGFGAFGVGFNTASVAGIPKTELKTENGVSFPVEVGTFSYNKSIMKVGYSMMLSQEFLLGTAISMYSSAVDTITSSAMDFDVGLSYEGDAVAVSALLRNITSSKVNYTSGGVEQLPMETVLGGAWFGDEFWLLGQMKMSGSNSTMVKSAALNYNPMIFSMAHISVGYREVAIGKQTQTRTAVGVGMDLGKFSADYAYETSDFPEYPGHHYFSVSAAL